MSLWDLLVAVVFFIAAVGALDSARHTQGGAGVFAVSLAVGVIIGACYAWTMRRVGLFVHQRTMGATSHSTRERYFLALYCSSLVWMLLSAVSGRWAAAALVRAIF